PDRDKEVYEFLDSLQKKGILKGYPDANFRGGRTLSRFEIAWALDRAINWILANVKFEDKPGTNGRLNTLDPNADVNVRDVATLQAFARKYAPIIDQLGVDVNVLDQKAPHPSVPPTF